MKEFQSEIEVENWLYDNYHDLIQYVQENCLIPTKENHANLLYLYGGNGNKLYNPILRASKGDKNIAEKYFDSIKQRNAINEIEVLDRFIRSKHLQHDLVLFRYVKLSLKEVINLLRTPKNDKIIDYGFLSTTLLQDCEGILELMEKEDYNVLYKLNTPKGIPGVPLLFNNDQTKLQEYEILLPTGIVKTLVRKSFNMKRRMLMFEFNLTYSDSEY